MNRQIQKKNRKLRGNKKKYKEGFDSKNLFYSNPRSKLRYVVGLGWVEVEVVVGGQHKNGPVRSGAELRRVVVGLNELTCSGYCWCSKR
jgi:hypothetical protein